MSAVGESNSSTTCSEENCTSKHVLTQFLSSILLGSLVNWDSPLKSSMDTVRRKTLTGRPSNSFVGRVDLSASKTKSGNASYESMTLPCPCLLELRARS
eukprot:4167682-Pleurochrysis_carterae.AAC.2